MLMLNAIVREECIPIGGYNGASSTVDNTDSRFRWRRILSRSSIPLLWRGPRHDTADRHYNPSVERLTVAKDW